MFLCCANSHKYLMLCYKLNWIIVFNSDFCFNIDERFDFQFNTLPCVVINSG